MRNRIRSLLLRELTLIERMLVWIFSIAGIVALGLIRVSTEAELTFASIAIVPVLVVGWACGHRDGQIAALAAGTMWLVSDLMVGPTYSPSPVVVLNGCTRLLTYSLVAYLASKVRFLLIREREAARHDVLTGLLNRRAFLEAGVLEVERCRRHRRPWAVAFLDLDNFKVLNDTRGHRHGDRALIVAADALRRSVRSTDRIGRLGGDEFVVLLAEISFDDTAETCRKLAATLDAAMAAFPPVSASLGAVWFENAEIQFSMMVEAADKLMYEIKQQGKKDVKVARYAR